jgi:hypothetical protein
MFYQRRAAPLEPRVPEPAELERRLERKGFEENQEFAGCLTKTYLRNRVKTSLW